MILTDIWDLQIEHFVGIAVLIITFTMSQKHHVYQCATAALTHILLHNTTLQNELFTIFKVS